MSENAAAAALLSKPVHSQVAAELAENPDGILEQIAGRHGVSTFDVVRALPEEFCHVVSAEAFETVMADMTDWGEILFIVHTPGIVLECKGRLPSGTFGRGYYNIHGDSPIGGHIKAERCAAIAFVSRPFMGRASASVQFFDIEGEAMFKVFVARDEKRELIPEQLARFANLRQKLGGV
ncbi:MAG: heme utilization cystosolic carrier protein HutX [Filomicrobium sp.]